MEQINDRIFQQTLANSVSFVGIGLHSGKKVRMNIRPARRNSGINFYRKDITGGVHRIAALWTNVTGTTLSTTLGNEFDVKIQTVEHVLAALRGCGIDNARIDINGPEVPIMDGSAAPFVEMINSAGKSVQRNALLDAIRIVRPIQLRLGDSIAILLPSNTPKITVSIDYPNTAIGSQTLSLEIDAETIQAKLAEARTFGFTHQVQALRNNGFALGGSLNNAILVQGNRIINEGGLRFPDEFVRHKMLDCFGDLSLAGLPIIGHYFARQPGHTINTRLIDEIFEQRYNWVYRSGKTNNGANPRICAVRKQ